jgi:hypothetical protein
MERTLVLGAIVGVVLTFVVAVPVSAGTAVDPNLNDTVLGKVDGIRYASDTAAYDAGSGFADVQAGCGSDFWRVFSGGANGGGSPASAFEAADQPVEYPFVGGPTDDGWDSGGYGSAPSVLTGYAICVHGASLRYRSKVVPDSATGLRKATVSCGPKAWHVVGGSTFIATTNSWINASFPADTADGDTVPDDAWTGRVFDTIGGIGGFDIHAVCARGVALRYVKRAPKSIAAGATVTARAACRASEHVVGGGVRVSGRADQARVVGSYPYDGPDAGSIPDDGWTARVHALSGGTKKVTAFAVCLKR